MRVCEVDPCDDAAFDDWFAVLEAARHVDRPGEPGWQRQELAALARRGGEPDAPTRTRTLAAEVDGELVGTVRLDLPQHDNTDLVEASLLTVAPQARGRGVGRLLLEAAADAGRAEGRRHLVVTLDELAGPSLPGRALAARLGLTCGQVEVRRDLQVPVDPARLQALEERCRPFSDGYALRLWGRACPDDLVEDRALLARRMSTDAPAGDVPRGEEEWDAARVRDDERLIAEQGRERLSAGAVHLASGRLVAVTDLVVPLGAPELAYQWDTLVLREHRGHRLGTLVKLANLRRVPQAWPRTRRISTWNAEENAPMIAVNEALGCEVVGTTSVWRMVL